MKTVHGYNAFGKRKASCTDRQFGTVKLTLIHISRLALCPFTSLTSFTSQGTQAKMSETYLSGNRYYFEMSLLYYTRKDGISQLGHGTINYLCKRLYVVHERKDRKYIYVLPNNVFPLQQGHVAEDTYIQTRLLRKRRKPDLLYGSFRVL